MDPGGGDEGRRWMWVGIAMALLTGLWMTAGVWGPRPPAGDDIQGQLLWNEFAIDKLFAHGHMDGWFPGFIVGYQKFLHYGPGFTWLVALVRVVTLGSVSTAGSLKVLTVISVLAVPPAVAFLVRSLGLDGRTAGIAAVLALAVDSPFGLGLSGVFTVGLLPQQMAATWLIVTLGAGFRVLHDPRARWILLAAGAGLMLVLTHPISVMMLAVFAVFAVAGLLVTKRPGFDGWRRLAVAVVMAAGVGAFWIVPYVAHRHLAGVLTAWATPPIGDRVADILTGRFVLRRYVGMAALVGLIGYAALVAMRRRRLSWAPLLPPVGYLIVAHTAAHFWKHSAAGTQLANRGVGLVGVLALIPLAALLGMTGERFGHLATGAVLAVALIGGLLIPGTGRAEARQQAEPVPSFQEVASVLHRVVPPGARFATERDYPDEIGRTGVSHPDFWLARHSGRNTLNVFGIELTRAVGAGIEPERLRQRPPLLAAADLAHLGVTHVVTLRFETADQLAADPDAFTIVWRSGPFAVLRVVAPPGQPDPSSLLGVEPAASAFASPATGEPEHVLVTAEAPAAARATLAIGYSPKWHLRIDGVSARLHQSQDGLLAFTLPAGSHALALDFRSDGWDRAGWCITLLSLAGLVAVATRTVLARRREQDQPETRPGRPSSSSRMSSSRSFTA